MGRELQLVCHREVIPSLFCRLPFPCAPWSPELWRTLLCPQLPLLHRRAFRRRRPPLRLPLIWEAAHRGPCISGVGGMGTVWAEVEVACRSRPHPRGSGSSGIQAVHAMWSFRDGVGCPATRVSAADSSGGRVPRILQLKAEAGGEGLVFEEPHAQGNQRTEPLWG